MDAKKIQEFLIDLKFNNNRQWFTKNKDRYEAASREFGLFIDSVIAGLRQLDNSIDISSSKDCVFRIFRDVRFSPNKEPYKTNFGALIARGGRKSTNPGYYLHFEPDNSFIGGGIYMPEPKALQAIRSEIYENTQEFKAILSDESFRKYFSEIYGEKLKMAPKGFPRDFSDIDLLKYKHYAVLHNVTDEFWWASDLLDRVIEIFRIQYKFNRFLTSAIRQSDN